MKLTNLKEGAMMDENADRDYAELIRGKIWDVMKDVSQARSRKGADPSMLEAFHQVEDLLDEARRIIHDKI